MNKNDKEDNILEQINSFVVGHIKLNTIDRLIAKYNFYFKQAHYKEIFIEQKKINKEIVPVKISMIDKIQYTNDFPDDDINYIRIFTLKANNETQYFTSTGSPNYFGEPEEHTKNRFLYLLENHKDLKDNELVRNLKASILHDELNVDLDIKEIKVKQPKI